MTWLDGIRETWTIGVAVGGAALVVGFLWWALADLFFATFDLPFGSLLDRWRQGVRSGDRHDENEGAGATA